VLPFSLVIDEETSWGEEVHVSKTSVAGNWGAVAGEIVYFADKSGRARGSISGTQLPYELIWEHAEPGPPELRYDAAHRRTPLRLIRTRTFHGFELDRDDQPIDRFPEGVEEAARRALAEAVVSGSAYHPDVPALRQTFRELREVWRRSGGTAQQVSEKALVDGVAAQLTGVNSYREFMEAPIRLDADALVPREERERWLALPDTVELQGEHYPLDYAFDGETAVVRARVPAKLLYRLDEDELPTLDRPLHWTVTRGKREAVRAATIEEAKVQLSEAGGPIKGQGRGKSRDRAEASAERGAGGDDERPRRRGQRGPGGGRNGGGPRGGGAGGGGGRRKGGGKQGRRKARH
jgi:ATP-dependent helicase HrpA